MSRPPRARPSRAKPAVAAVSSSFSAPPVPTVASASSVPSASIKELKDTLLFNGGGSGTDSDRDDDKTAKTGRDRERDRERDRDRRKRDNATTTNKLKLDKQDKENAATATSSSTASTSTTVSSAKRKAASSATSASAAFATPLPAQSKPKQAAKQQQQRTVTEAESPEGEVYCVCRLPNTGEAMICCEECDEWYHFRCIGMTAAEAARTEHYVCASCKRDSGKRAAAAKEADGKKRRRDEEAGKATGAARVNGVDGEVEGKRTRRQRNGVEERDEDMGDGTGKWLKKDMVVESESDEEEWIYMTSDDETLPQQPAMAVKLESSTVKQEDALTPTVPSASSPSPSLPSPTIHRLPRISTPAVPFDRPDYRLHPLIRQTAPRAPRQPRSSSPTRSSVGSLAIDCATSVRSVVQHRWLLALQQPDRQCSEDYILRQVSRCVQRWLAVLEEYEWEEKKRQMQLSAEEWRWRRLIHHYLNHELDTAPQSENGIRPPPTSFELLLSSALPVGLGHPRFVHDTQEVVNAAHEKSVQSDAMHSFHSQQNTPSSYAAPTISTTSSSTSRLTFHFHRVRRDPADFVSLDTLWCVGCAGYIPVDEYATHIRDCCETAITTPDQKLVVVVPYEQPMPEPLAVEMDAPVELEKVLVLGEVDDADVKAKRKEKEEAADKADATKWELGDKPDANVLAMGRFHQQLASRRALSLQFDARQHSSDPAGRFPLREYLNKQAPEAKPAEPLAVPAALLASSSRPPLPYMSMSPASRLITRYQRFLNPALFPTLLCGYPLLSNSQPVPLYFCAHLHSECNDHSGWEERWDMDRRTARLRLEGRLRAVKADTEGMKRVLDVEEKERLAGKAAINSAQLVTSALSAYLEAEKADAANEASPAASELSDGSGQDMEEETAVEAHTLQRRPVQRDDSSSEGSSEGSDAAEANGTVVGGGDKKRTDRERLRERERINKQRQRERAKAREREKELRLREKERSREKKREKRKRKEKERERKERRRDKDRHAHKKKKSSSRSGVRRRDESSSSEHSSNSSDERSDDSRTSLSSDARDY